MPEINFVLPHWLYWAGLILFPALAMFLFRRGASTGRASGVSLPLAYLLLILGGFIGVHRLYLRNMLAFLYIALFVSILVVNVETREARDVLSSARNDVSLTKIKISRSEKNLLKAQLRYDRNQNERNQRKLGEINKKLIDHQSNLNNYKSTLITANLQFEKWGNIASLFGIAIIIFLIIDVFLLPGLVKKRSTLETDKKPEPFHCPAVEEPVHKITEPFAFNRWISQLNLFVGEFVAYWSVIAVFVYYYEVIARYVFNSPTNWAHEGMFLMFGMQYLLAGGYCLRENSHVRVDVIYMRLSERTKALMDMITSVFFFIFVITLLVTGWIFFNDSWSIKEVSFTEWAIQYYPIKMALPLGATLILLQGISRLVMDTHTFILLLKAKADNPVQEQPLGT